MRHSLCIHPSVTWPPIPIWHRVWPRRFQLLCRCALGSRAAPEHGKVPVCTASSCCPCCPFVGLMISHRLFSNDQPQHQCQEGCFPYVASDGGG